MTKALPESCLNCGERVDSEMKFCPNCGQRNRETKIPLKEFAGDFVQDYFTIDAKVFKSIGLLISKPGELTKRFNLGKRKSYIAPFRLYIFISFLYFFLLAVDQKREGYFDKNVIEFSPPDSLEAAIAEVQQGIDSLESAGLLTDVDRKDAEQTLQKLDSIRKNGEAEDFIISFNDGESGEMNEVETYLVKQAKKINDNPELFGQTLFKTASIVMFVFLPLFGFLLYLFHFRRAPYYVEHLVHSVHFHAFVFILCLFALISNIIFNWSGFEWLFLFGFIYLTLSMRSVYGQTFIKSILKALGILSIYTILLTIGVLVVVISSVIIA